MKKLIKAANYVPGPTETLWNLKGFLNEVGVSDSELLHHFMDYLTSDEGLEILKDYAKDWDIELPEGF